MREKIIDEIFKIAQKQDAFDILEKEYSFLSRDNLSSEIVQIGIMPEVFEHDSSEEKLWSKLSDIILASALNYLGLQCNVIRTRGDSADVYGKTDGYTIVSDAKCFRLSRTAKNQKDFKIKALDDWRRQDTYALLVGPLYQYPIDKSQIYRQAISKNVTLLSYTHLRYLLDKSTHPNLLRLWEVGNFLNKKYSVAEKQRGSIYWETIDNIVCDITDTILQDLKEYKKEEISKTKELGEEGINYWQSKINDFKKLSREEAIKMLINAQKIEQKIETIKKAISRRFVI